MAAAVTASTSPPVSLSPSSESNPDRWRWASLPAWLHHPIAAGLALCGMVAVSYYPALFGGFVIDDHIFADSPAVHAWSGLWNIWFSPDDLEGERHYWPILYTTFWLEHKLWGLAPFGYHLVNVLLYMVNVLLLWVLLRRLAVPGAWAVAVVFAVHPMHVDSVAWVIGRKDLLSGLFCMAAALCWMRSTASFGVSRTDCPDDLVRVPWRWLPDSLRVPRPALYFAAVGLFAAAMLSKSVVVTPPGRLRDRDLVETRASDVDGWVQNRTFLAGRPVHLPRRPVLLHVRAAGTRLRLRVCRAGADRRPSPVVLRRQAGMACRLGGRRPVVGYGHRGFARLGLRHRGYRSWCASLVCPPSAGSGASRRRGVLRGDVISGAGLRGLRPHADFLCGRPLRVSGRHRCHLGRRRWRRLLFGQASECCQDRGSRCARRRSRGLRKADVGTGWHLSR